MIPVELISIMFFFASFSCKCESRPKRILMIFLVVLLESFRCTYDDICKIGITAVQPISLENLEIQSFMCLECSCHM